MSGRRHEPDDHDRDEGSALVLVLVYMVTAALLMIPLMNHSIAVYRANRVLSEKTQRMEAVRGALRVALADPMALYETCGEAGESVSRPLASANLDGVGVSSRCYFIDFASAQDDEQRRYGLALTQVGAELPVALTGTRFIPADPTDPGSWLADAESRPLTNTVWLPNLPVHPLTPRAATPYQMPVGYPQCNVYFPGTYTEPLVLSGPTYFASGIYYFEAEVSVVDGASVVVGQGGPGCSTDQEVAFYVENPPSTHHINGQGATWVFGDGGRLVVRSAGTAPISLMFSQRYVQADDDGSLPSQGVSIVSVNGDAGVAGEDLLVPGLLQVPASLVGSASPSPAAASSLVPSTLTPSPRAPSPPQNVQAVPRSGHVRVTWDAPESMGGSALTESTVTVRDTDAPATTFSCTVPADRRDCTVGGLVNGRSYSVSVATSNAVGASTPALAAAPVTPTTGAGTVTAPGAPGPVTVTGHDGAVLVTWAPPVNDGGAAVTSWSVVGSPSGTCTAGYGATSCVVTGLATTGDPGYTFQVTATNLIGPSVPSASSGPVQPVGAPWVPPEEEPPAPAGPVVPDPIVDLDLATAPSGAATVTVEIPGYVAVPQGRIRVLNPHGHEVVLRGGLLAASVDLTDARASEPPEPDQLPIGFIETVVQRKFRIVSETSSGTPRLTSTAVVQVNKNGAYAINSWEVR